MATSPPPLPSGTGSTAPSWPLGILESVHTAALAAAPLGSLDSWIHYAILPAIPLYLQAYVLVGPQGASSRALRAALGMLGIALMVRGWLSYRFTGEQHGAAWGW